MGLIDLSTSIGAAKGSALNPIAGEGEAPGVLLVEDGKLGRDVTADYNQITCDTRDSVEQNTAKLEMWIAKNVGTPLGQTYPNREWSVRVDCEAGYIAVQCPSVSLRHEYILHLKGSNIHDLQERAVMAAGEILERYGLSRERRFDADILETLDRDHTDEVRVQGTSADPIMGIVKRPG